MKKFFSNIPVPYWIGHAALALGVAALLLYPFGLTAGLAAGAFFYVGREFTQWEQGGGKGLPFDWAGLLAPVIVCLFVYLAIMYMGQG